MEPCFETATSVQHGTENNVIPLVPATATNPTPHHQNDGDDYDDDDDNDNDHYHIHSSGTPRSVDETVSIARAAAAGDCTRLQGLLAAGAPVNCHDEAMHGDTPLMIAAAHGSADGVELLLCHGADMTAVNRQRMTALMAGAIHQHEPALTQLLYHATPDQVR